MNNGRMPRNDVLPQHIQGLVTQEKEKKWRVNNTAWTLMLIVEVLVYSSYSILVHLSKVRGHLPFNTSTVVLLIEFTKLLISSVMYLPVIARQRFAFPAIPLITCLYFGVPALLYAFNNNVALMMQLHMDPTTYQVLCNLKIASTALLYRWIIKRKITSAQWVALGLLVLAGVSDSYGGFHTKLQTKARHQIFITFQGMIMMLAYCTVSGLAAVFTEYILKKQFKMSIHLQNMLMYAYGIVLNGFMSLWQHSSSDHNDLFTGFSIYTWIIIITQASNGLIMSLVMKHGSNLTRLFIISGAMLSSTILSMLVLGTQLNGFFILAAGLVVLALYLYHK